jgi:hypothetical protein
MLGMRTLGPRVLDCGLVSAQAEAAEREQMGGVGAAGLDGVQAAGEEEGVFREAVVEVVVDELAQLRSHARRRRRRHGKMVWGG